MICLIYEKIEEELIQHIEIILQKYKINKSQIIYEISEPSVKEHGDLSCNIAFSLSKILKRSPLDICNEIVNELFPQIMKKNENSLIANYSYAKPGFINFKLNMNAFLSDFFDNIENITDLPNNKKNKELILIEHTSVNPNKSLHVGHLRNSIIGDCLFRILKETGHNVKVLNYIDDSGLQVADIIVGLKYAGIADQYPQKDNQKFDHYCGNYVYVKINELYESRKDLVEKRKEILKYLESPSSEISLYTKNIVDRILKEQLNTCWRIKCHYDLLNFESQIIQSKIWKDVFQILKDLKLIHFETNGKNTGCWIFKSKSEGEKILIRSDSTLTYFAKDIPYALWKIGYLKNPFEFEVYSEQWDSTLLYKTTIKEELFIGKNRINKYNDKLSVRNKSIIDFSNVKEAITIIDFRQERLQNILIEILESIGINKCVYKYLGYEPVSLSYNTAKMIGIDTENKRNTQMSGRKGIFVEADTALNLLEEKSFEEVKKRNYNIDQNQISVITKEIAISALRYYFIKQDMSKMITFDINDSLNLEGDTGPYIQYSYARGNKVFTKIKELKFNLIQSNNIPNFKDFSTTEIDLIKHLCKYSIKVSESSKNHEPKLIARYLFELSTLFNNFYESSPILKGIDEDQIESLGKIKEYRIKILKSSLKVMEKCMEMIGISILNRM